MIHIIKDTSDENFERQINSAVDEGWTIKWETYTRTLTALSKEHCVIVEKKKQAVTNNFSKSIKSS
jgi:hypothetical protein